VQVPHYFLCQGSKILIIAFNPVIGILSPDPDLSQLPRHNYFLPGCYFIKQPFRYQQSVVAIERHLGSTFKKSPEKFIVLPVIGIGVFSEDLILAFPLIYWKQYETGIKNVLFNDKSVLHTTVIRHLLYKCGWQKNTALIVKPAGIFPDEGYHCPVFCLECKNNNIIPTLFHNYPFFPTLLITFYKVYLLCGNPAGAGINKKPKFYYICEVYELVQVMNSVSEHIPVERIKPIDIRKIFYSKNPGLAALLPGFVFRYLERIAHQHDINVFLERHGEKTGLDFARAAIQEFNVHVIIKGDENLPREGRFIFAANHPLGGFDGILLMDVMSRYYPDFKFLSNDLLMNITNLHPLFIPVNKHGKQAVEAAARLDAAFRSGTHIVTFPSGFVSRYINGQVMDLEWKKNFISKALQYNRDIIPVHFTGRNSKFFYGLYRVRKFFGIQANLEMFYLVDETFKHRNDTLTVTFGEPIPYTRFDKSKSPLQWAKWVKEQVYALGGVTEVPV